MAKKNRDAKREEKKGSRWASMKMFFVCERTRFITGLLLEILTIYVALAMVSFFFTGGADQSKIENVPFWPDLAMNRGAVANWTGAMGAYVSDVLMNRWFGVSTFFLLFFVAAVGAKLMNLRRVRLMKCFLFSAASMICGSVLFAFLFVKGYEDTFFYLGGLHGHLIAEALETNLGIPGTALVLLATLTVIAIFASPRTIPALQKAFTFGWLKRKKKAEVPSEPEAETSEPEEKPAEPEESYAQTEEFDTEAELKAAGIEEVPAPAEPEPAAEPEIEETKEEQPTEMEIVDATRPTEEHPVAEVPGEKKEEPTQFEVNIPKGEEMDFEGKELGDYDPRLDLSRYIFPSLDLLKDYDTGNVEVSKEDLYANQQLIKQALEDFSISIASIKATVGPTVTLYEIIPAAGVRISKIKTLEDDIALSLSALQIRIIAPMPGKGTIGIEVPNRKPQVVSMQSVIASRKFQECKYDLPVAMGRTITNEVFMFDLCKTPHLLVAGATGQGKSVGLNAIITSLLYKKHPAELKFVMVDPKMVEFSIYSKIERHYLAKLPNEDNPIVTEPADAVATLNSLVTEMENRYKLLVSANVRNIKEYNTKFISRTLNPNKGHRFLPYIVAVVDEFADLIITAGREIEIPISRIAAKARAVGIHMILATQRPDAKVITGTIKSNFPSRIAFKVASMIDSRTILDAPGANRLIGRGDMLIMVAGNDTVRVQCAFVDTPEVEQIVNFIGEQPGYPTAYLLPEYVAEGDGKNGGAGAVDMSDLDPLFDEAARLVVIQQQGSTSLIQRKFSIGYNRAGRVMDQLEAAGIVGPFEGSKARQVLVPDEFSLEQVLKDVRNKK